MSRAPEATVRRFAAFLTASMLWKVAALAVFLVLLVRLGLGGDL